MATHPRPADARALLTDLYWAAVTAAAPGPALRSALAAHPPAPGRAIHILSLGKAAQPMATAAVETLSALGRAPAGGLLVVPEPAPSPHPALRVAVGDHPQPGAGSLAAADALASAVRAVRPEDEVWVLLSGGTTSLIGAPIEGLAAADLTELYRLLLGSGLDITAMNQIRKRFARWAAGRLATALAPAHVKNFTISDVIGDDLGSIGSGPCVPDSSNATEVRAALTSAGLWEQLPLRSAITSKRYSGVKRRKPPNPMILRFGQPPPASSPAIAWPSRLRVPGLVSSGSKPPWLTVPWQARRPMPAGVSPAGCSTMMPQMSRERKSER